MEIEKYIPKRINKDTSPEAIDARGGREYLPGEMTDALNCQYYLSGKDGVLRNTPGNGLINYELPTGNNKVLKAFKNEKSSTLIYFIYNDTDAHSIVEYNPTTAVFTTLMQGASLAFAENAVIQGGIIDIYLIWTDGTTFIKKINIQRARDGGYTSPYTTHQISLQAFPPIDPPTWIRGTDATKDYNYISDTNWMFAYNFIYNDNEESVFSPLSIPASGDSVYDATDTTNNKLVVTIQLPTELIGLVKRIDVACRKNAVGDYYIFKKIDQPSATSYTFDFFNDDVNFIVPKSRQIAIADAIPPVSDSIEIMKNRLFCPLNQVGFDVDESLFTLTPSIYQHEIFNPDPDPLNSAWVKEGSSHGIGIIFYDEFNNPSFVKSKSFISIPRTPIITGISAPVTTPVPTMRVAPNGQLIEWTLTGTPPPGMVRYSIVSTPDVNFVYYFQCMAMTYRYLRELGPDETDNYFEFLSPIDNIPPGTYPLEYGSAFNWRGKHWTVIDPGSTPSKLYLQIPTNIPISPEPGDFVRILSPGFPDLNLVIEDVFGDLIDVGPGVINGIFDFRPFRSIMIEVYRPTQQKTSEVFFEGGDFYDIVDGEFSVTSGKLPGDTFNVELNSQYGVDSINTKISYLYQFIGPITTNNDSFLVMNSDLILGDLIYTLQSIEVPVKQLSRSTATVNVVTGQKRDTKGWPSYSLTEKRWKGENSPSVALTDSEKLISVYTFDYTKITGPYGRPFTSNDNEKRLNLDTTYGFSDPYIQESYVNGLNVFPAENLYSISVDRGRSRTLRRVGDVLLAIHERYSSTLYIGEGFLRQGKDFLLAKTTTVVGDDRKMQESYGTINPESFIEVDGQGLWWDGLNGAMVRYTNAGLFPISSNGMDNYFREKAIELFPYRDQVRVVSGFDYRTKEVIFTFQDVIVDNVIVIPGVTWAFNMKKEVWTTRYSFLPECYGTLLNQLFSFKTGAMWEHYKAGVAFNTFYGIKYNRTWRIISNAQIGKNKRYLNVHHKGEIAEDNSSEDAVVRIYTKEGQESFIPAYEFELDEGKYCAAILKDINSDVDAGRLALRSGEDIVSDYAEIEFINNRQDESICSQVNVVYKTEAFSI